MNGARPASRAERAAMFRAANTDTSWRGAGVPYRLARPRVSTVSPRFGAVEVVPTGSPPAQGAMLFMVQSTTNRRWFVLEVGVVVDNGCDYNRAAARDLGMVCT